MAQMAEVYRERGRTCVRSSLGYDRPGYGYRDQVERNCPEDACSSLLDGCPGKVRANSSSVTDSCILVDLRRTSPSTHVALSRRRLSSSCVTRMRSFQVKTWAWFLNLCQGNELAEDVFGQNFPRLRGVKATYDPKKVFGKGIVIEPAHHPNDSV